jgi:hypothetical protein
MRSPRSSLSIGAVLLATFVATQAATAAQAPAAPVAWTSVAKTDRQEAFVDPASRRERDGFLEAVVRYDYVEPQPYGRKSFLSARNVYRFDCANARIADRENRVYAERDLQGKEVANASRGAKNPVWRNALPKTVDGVVLDYVCRKLAGGGPAAAPARAPTTDPKAQAERRAPSDRKPPGDMPQF